MEKISGDVVKKSLENSKSIAQGKQVFHEKKKR